MLNANLIFSTLSQCILALTGLWMLTAQVNLEAERTFTIIATLIYIILCNYAGFLSYILQVSSKIKEYSKSVVIDKIGFMIVVLIGIVVRCSDFRVYIICYLISKMVSTVYTMIKCREIILSKIAPYKEALKDVIDNISVGLNLMISNVISMLILGVGRTLIDHQWGLEQFGKFSLALSLSNFFLQFISQISLVLFPTFRRVGNDKAKQYYMTLRTLLSVILSGMLLGYMPMYYLLSYWLPQYAESLRYMVILLPICTFDGKMNMLCNTYLKVLRKEKILLIINVLSLGISSVLCSICTFIIKDIYAVIVAMVVSVAIRSIIAEIYLSRYFAERILKSVLVEVLLSILFVSITWFTNAVIGFGIYLLAYSLFIIAKRKTIVHLFGFIKKGESI